MSSELTSTVERAEVVGTGVFTAIKSYIHTIFSKIANNSIRDLFLALLTFNSLFEACTSYSRLSIDSCKLRQAHMQPHTSTLSCNLVRSSARGDPMRGCTAIERAKGEQTCKNELTADELTRANGQTSK